MLRLFSLAVARATLFLFTCVLVVAPIQADTVHASASIPLSVSTTVTFNWLGSVNVSGALSDTEPLSITLPGAGIPTGATLTSAILQLTTDPGGLAAVNTSRSENDFQYVVGYQPVYEWRCFHYGWFGCESGGYVQVGQSPILATGSGGTASFAATYGNSVNVITSSSNTVNIAGPGTYNLLAMGFGPDLAAGNTIVVNGYAYLNLQFNISDYGYQASTTYNASASDSGSLEGLLLVNYELPSQVPESSAAMLALIALAGYAARQLKRAVR